MKKSKKLSCKAIFAIVISVILAVAVSAVATFGAIFFTRFSTGVKPTEEQLATSVKYDHVVIFGVDGAGAYFDTANVPNFDRIYANGNVNYRAYSQYPTTSAHNWTSMFHGVRYQVHGVNNDVADSTHFTNEEYPSFFKLWSEQNPDATMLSVVNWIPTNTGCIEENINGLKKINVKENLTEPTTTGSEIDDLVCETILNELDSYTPDILFMQFDSVDGAGHDDGYGSQVFGEALTHIDSLIGKIYDKYVENGCGENTLFITVSDHCHGVQYPGHGHNGATQRYVTMAIAGGLGNVIAGTPGHAVTQDIASIVAFALGMEQCENWESRVPYGIFSDLPSNPLAELLK